MRSTRRPDPETRLNRRFSGCLALKLLASSASFQISRASLAPLISRRTRTPEARRWPGEAGKRPSRKEIESHESFQHGSLTALCCAACTRVVVALEIWIIVDPVSERAPRLQGRERAARRSPAFVPVEKNEEQRCPVGIESGECGRSSNAVIPPDEPRLCICRAPRRGSRPPACPASRERAQSRRRQLWSERECLEAAEQAVAGNTAMNQGSRAAGRLADACDRAAEKRSAAKIDEAAGQDRPYVSWNGILTRR